MYVFSFLRRDSLVFTSLFETNVFVFFESCAGKFEKRLVDRQNHGCSCRFAIVIVKWQQTSRTSDTTVLSCARGGRGEILRASSCFARKSGCLPVCTVEAAARTEVEVGVEEEDHRLPLHLAAEMCAVVLKKKYRGFVYVMSSRIRSSRLIYIYIKSLCRKI